METVQTIDLIVTNPNVRGGRAHIVGTTVTVSDVVMARLYHGQDADRIAEWYRLTLARTYAALAYYYQHKAEIDQQIREQIQQARALKEQRIGGQDSLDLSAFRSSPLVHANPAD